MPWTEVCTGCWAHPLPRGFSLEVLFTGGQYCGRLWHEQNCLGQYVLGESLIETQQRLFIAVHELFHLLAGATA